MADARRIGEILVSLRVLTEAQVERVLLAVKRRGKAGKFGQVAREMGLLREEHVLAALAVQMQLVPHSEQMSLTRLLDSLCRPTPVCTAPPRQKVRAR